MILSNPVASKNNIFVPSRPLIISAPRVLLRGLPTISQVKIWKTPPSTGRSELMFSPCGIYTVYIYGAVQECCVIILSQVCHWRQRLLSSDFGYQIPTLSQMERIFLMGCAKGLFMSGHSDRAISDSIGMPRPTVKDWRKSEFRYQRKRGSGRPLATDIATTTQEYEIQ